MGSMGSESKTSHTKDMTFVTVTDNVEAAPLHAIVAYVPSPRHSKEALDSLREQLSACSKSTRQSHPDDRGASEHPLTMSSSLVVCEVDESLKAKLRKFRFRKETNNAAILMKIDMEKQLVIFEEEYEDITLDELRDELPERQPRFIVYSYKYVHDDGRVSYPMCFIFSSPMGCKPMQQMMYAGSKNRLVQDAELTKVFETRTADDLTEEWLRSQLAFFK